MKRIGFVFVMMCASLHAWSFGRLANLEVLNRDTGETLPVYRHQGEYWIAGNPGARYALVIHNLLGERLLAVTSVDGVNVVSGETAAWNQTGYVFEGGETCAINGWRKNNQEVADFNFTALPDSYAARTGRPANAGIIGVALFLERRLPAAQVQPEISGRFGSRSAPPPTAQAAPAAPAAERQDSLANSAADSARRRLGTGHGAREASYVSITEFERRSDSPNEIIRIRYDRFDNLVAMGIVRARTAPYGPNAFPDSDVSRYVPDPPGGI